LIAVLFALLLSLRIPRDADAGAPPQVHYAAPADSPPDRTSAVGFIRLVVWEPE
jgi:hypothetical protein